jgi:hypothetical protein
MDERPPDEPFAAASNPDDVPPQFDGEPPPVAAAEPPLGTAELPPVAAESPTEPPPLAAPPPPPPRAAPPRVGETVAGAFDLALAASRQIRRASVYVGILTLALVGPATVLFLAIVRDQGGLEAAADFVAGSGAFTAREEGALTMLQLSLLCGGIGLFALLIEAQIIATAIIGGVAANRRIGVRDSLRLSRAVFWRVVAAAILVGILRAIVGLLTAAILDPSTEAEFEGTQIWDVVFEAVATAPFAYFLAGIVIGGVGPIETLRRSVRVARARWRLAIVVASAGAVIAFIQAFALGAGLDVIFRVSTAAGLGLDGPPHVAVLTGGLILAAVVAIGSLLVTITALTVAPQVFVFLRMTGYSAGLDRAFAPAAVTGPPKRPRLVTWPMLVLVVLGCLAAIAGLSAI